MRQVQTALANIGIPVMAGIWRATSSAQNPPNQYVVYSTTVTEAAHEDDRVTAYRTYVYMNLWSKADPTSMVSTIRSAMYAGGFSLVEETDRGYNQTSYDTATSHYSIAWTWCYYEEVERGTN